jgi:hypothetical protein
MKLRLCATAAALTLSLGGVAGVAIPASAAGCSGFGCDGQDPVATGCANSAVTVASVNIWNWNQSVLLGRVDMRWSNSCHTNWARTVSYVNPGEPFAEINRTSDGAVKDSQFGADGGTVWSPLLYGQGKCTWAYGQISLMGSNQTGQVC